MNRIAYWLARIRDSFWFVPAVLIALALALAEALVAVDLSADWEWLPLLGVGPDGARGLLAAIATSMLSAAATMFSITIAVLALTSSAYGPRLVQNFMADRGNQLVLAVLVSSSLYSLMVLRRIRSGSEAFVPELAVTVGLALALVGVCVLIYFIHHISAGIQIANLAGGVRRELAGRLADQYPATADARRRPADSWPSGGVAREALADADGYVTSVALDDLVSAATRHEGRVDVLVHPGTFVCGGDVIALVTVEADAEHDDADRERATAEERLEQLCRATVGRVSIGDQRTPYQDVEHLARQLIDVAARSLSPGVNDPYTALNAIDALSAAFAPTAAHPDPHPVLVDDDGAVRTRASSRAWIDLVVDTIDTLRVYASTQPVVGERLIDCVGRLLRRTTDPERRVALLAAADRVVEGADASAMLPHDLERLRAARTILEGRTS